MIAAPTKTGDDEAVLAALQSLVDDLGTQTAVAKQLGISLPYLNDVLRGRRDIGALAQRLGYAQLRVFVPGDEQPPITAAEAAKLIDGLRRRRMPS